MSSLIAEEKKQIKHKREWSKQPQNDVDKGQNRKIFARNPTTKTIKVIPRMETIRIKL